jgi:hypothetical protein
MTDIVERLRLSVTRGHEPTDEDAIEAADEIERLLAQHNADGRALEFSENDRERLREATPERFYEIEAWNDNLRAEIERSDKAWREMIDGRDAEIGRLREEVHYAKGTCDLAMKHRDVTEAEIERLREQTRCSDLAWHALLDRHDAEIERLQIALSDIAQIAGEFGPVHNKAEALLAIRRIIRNVLNIHTDGHDQPPPLPPSRDA